MTHKVTYDSDNKGPPDFGLMIDSICGADKSTIREQAEKALEAAYGYGYYAGKNHDWWKTIEAAEDDHWKD